MRDKYIIVLYFNPRPREEGDLVILYFQDKGAYFNPRPRKEGDGRQYTAMTEQPKFQSTPSQRGRLDGV